MYTTLARHPFDVLVSQPEAEIQLARAALLFTIDEYPRVHPDAYLRQLEALAQRVADLPAYTPAQRIEALRHVLVEEEGFKGSQKAFTDPEASYLNRVIDTRCGLPISLSAVWMHVASCLDWPIHGVGMPGHFIISYDDPGGERIFVDPFNGGARLSREDCAQMQETMFGESLTLSEAHLEVSGTFSILERMLGNLYAVLTTAKQWSQAAEVLRRVLAFRPESAIHAELGRMLALTGAHREASAALEAAESLAATAEERKLVRAHQATLRRSLSENN